MAELSEIIEQELNPKNDMYHVKEMMRLHKLGYTALKETMVLSGKEIGHMAIAVFKPLVRGTMIGGVIGTAYGLVSGDSTAYKYCAAVGTTLDVTQFSFRFSFELAKDVYLDASSRYRAFKAKSSKTGNSSPPSGF